MTIKTTRPRIFLTEERLAYLCTPEAQDRPAWQKLRTWCSQGWPLGEAVKGRDQHHANNYGLIYAVTGEERYGRKAIAMCETYMAMPGFDALTKVGTSSAHGFGARIVLPEMACTYDWCHPLLTPAERTRWQAQMVKWADWCWLETNPTKPTQWGQHHPGDNFHHGFLMTGLVGLALGSDHSRGMFHADFAWNKWKDMWFPYLERFGSGTSLEGTAYGTHKLLSFFTAAYRSASDSLGPDWVLPEAAEGRIHLTAPDFKHLAPLGGQPSAASAPITDYHRTLMLVALTHSGKTVAGLSRDWLDRAPPPRWRWTAWEEALWYDPRVEPVKIETRPTTHHFEGAGLVSARTSWEEDATWLLYECGPTLETHQDLGAGQLHLYTAGDWLTTNARLWGYGGGMHPTEYTNSVMVGPHGQPGVDTNRILPKDLAGKIISVEDTGGTLEIDSEFHRAYDYRSGSKALPRLTEARRRLLWIKPGWLLIRDKFTKVNAADELTLLIQCKQPPILSQGLGAWVGFAVQRADEVTMDGQVLTPAGTRLRTVEILKGPKGVHSSWRLEIVIPGGSLNVEVAWLLEIDQ